MKCPYEPTITDEASECVVSNPRYQDWMAGYDARTQEVKSLMSELADRANELSQAIKYIQEEKYGN